MSIVFVALSLLAWIMSRHSECCVCFRYICTYDSYKETVIKVLQSRSDYVPKLSIAILILSIGPDQPYRRYRLCMLFRRVDFGLTSARQRRTVLSMPVMGQS